MLERGESKFSQSGRQGLPKPLEEAAIGSPASLGMRVALQDGDGTVASSSARHSQGSTSLHTPRTEKGEEQEYQDNEDDVIVLLPSPKGDPGVAQADEKPPSPAATDDHRDNSYEQKQQAQQDQQHQAEQECFQYHEERAKEEQVEKKKEEQKEKHQPPETCIFGCSSSESTLSSTNDEQKQAAEEQKERHHLFYGSQTGNLIATLSAGEPLSKTVSSSEAQQKESAQESEPEQGRRPSNEHEEHELSNTLSPGSTLCDLSSEIQQLEYTQEQEQETDQERAEASSSAEEKNGGIVWVKPRPPGLNILRPAAAITTSTSVQDQQDEHEQQRSKDTHSQAISNTLCFSPTTAAALTTDMGEHDVLEDATIDEEYEDEHLGDDFRDTPWVPPSIERAQRYREAALFHRGLAPLLPINYCCAERRKKIHLSDLGIGTKLHFCILNILIRGFALLFLLNAPALFIMSSGTRIKKEGQNMLGFNAFTLGNIGSSGSSTDGASIPVYLGNKTFYFRQNDVAIVLSAMDLLSCLVFLGMIWCMARRLERVKRHQSKTVLSAKDFTVFVTNLPKNVEKKDIIEHFSNLYPLDSPDWKDRQPPSSGKRKYPVYDITHVHGDRRYFRKWVAEVVIARRNGAKLRAFLMHESKTVMLKRYRAYLKKYNLADDSCNSGCDRWQYKKYAQRLQGLQRKMGVIADTLQRNKQIARVEKECVGAFVCFEYPESAKRCVEDYNSMNLFHFFCFPGPLLFQGRHRLSVRPAPAPEDIMWENLEVSRWSRFSRRLLVNFLTCLILLLSFGITVLITNIKTKQNFQISNFSLCDEEIPALFVAPYGSGNQGQAPPLVYFMSPPTMECPTCNDQCSHIFPSSSTRKSRKSNAIFALYSSDPNVFVPAANYSLAACSDDPCPEPGKPSRCPCVVSDSSHLPQCQTLACFNKSNHNQSSISSGNCGTFPYSTIAACFCYDRLHKMASSKGGWLSFRKSLSIAGEENSLCANVARSIVVQVMLQIILSFTTLAINALLPSFMYWLTSFEHNNSADVEASQVMIKVFVAQFINTAILLLVVYGGYAEAFEAGQAHVKSWASVLKSVLRRLGIFAGQFHDTTSEWYTVVGVQFQFTALIASVSPHVYPLTCYLILAPARRFIVWIYNIFGKPRFVMQRDLNDLYVGPRFDIVSRAGQMLTTVFFTFFYSSGMPLMLLWGLGTFLLSYGIDYLLLLRFYKRPHQRDERLHRTFINCLPYAVVLHLSMAIWMFGNEDLLGRGGRVNMRAPSAEDLSINIPSRHQQDHSFVNTLLTAFISRVSKVHIAPLFLLWAILLVYLVVVDFLPGYKSVATLARIKQVVKATFCSSSSASGRRRTSRVGNDPEAMLDVRTDNGYTKIFERPVPANYSSPRASTASSPRSSMMSSPREYTSWQVFVNDEGANVLRKVKSPSNSLRKSQSPRSSGEGFAQALMPPTAVACKKTWELIKINALWTYDISRNPKYRDSVMTFMREFLPLASSSSADTEDGELEEQGGISTIKEMDEEDECERGAEDVNIV